MSSETLPFTAARALDVAMVLDALGVEKLRRKHHYRCPACDTKGLRVYKDGGSQCHTCDEQYNAIDLTMAVNQSNEGDAVRWLAARYGLSSIAADRFYTRPRPHRQVAARERAKAAAARDIYKWIAREGSLPRAQDYLRSRAISMEAARASRAVSIDEELWGRMRARFDDASLLAAGLLREGDDGALRPLLFAFPALAMPYRDAAGEIRQMRFGVYGEARDRDRRKYLSCFDTLPEVLYGEEEADCIASRDLYLLEGEINAMSLRSIGEHAWACCGTGTWEDTYCARIAAAIGNGHLILFLDGDDASSKWAADIIESFAMMLGDLWVKEHIEVIQSPPGRDANDLLRANLLRGLLRAGSWGELKADRLYRIAAAFYSDLQAIYGEDGPREEEEANIARMMATADRILDPRDAATFREREAHLYMARAYREPESMPPGLSPFGRVHRYIEESINQREEAPARGA